MCLLNPHFMKKIRKRKEEAELNSWDPSAEPGVQIVQQVTMRIKMNGLVTCTVFSHIEI